VTGKKVWLITGAGRGLGVDIAKAVLAAGHSVVATGRDASKVAAAVGVHDNLLTTKLDVTRPQDAKACAGFPSSSAAGLRHACGGTLMNRLHHTASPPLRALLLPMVWVASLPYFFLITTQYGYTFWAPTMIRDALQTSNTTIGLIAGGIACVAAGVMLVVGASSDHRGNVSSTPVRARSWLRSGA